MQVSRLAFSVTICAFSALWHFASQDSVKCAEGKCYWTQCNLKEGVKSSDTTRLDVRMSVLSMKSFLVTEFHVHFCAVKDSYELPRGPSSRMKMFQLSRWKDAIAYFLYFLMRGKMRKALLILQIKPERGMNCTLIHII